MLLLQKHFHVLTDKQRGVTCFTHGKVDHEAAADCRCKPEPVNEPVKHIMCYSGGKRRS